MAAKKYRLTDIHVEEVSLVDRAANKRRFLVKKRDQGMALKADGRGGFIEKADDEDENTDAVESDDNTPAGDASGEPTAKAEAEKAEAAKAEAEKAEKAEADGTRVAKLTALATRVIEIAKMDSLPGNFQEEIQGYAADIAGNPVTELQKAEAKLAELAKANKVAKSDLERENAALKEKVRKFEEQPAGSPNARRVEGEVNKSESDDDDSGWPIDMNSPIMSPAEAKKNGTSFYD